MELKIETPRAFLPLLGPARFKGARGGRGAAKSWFVADRLIEDSICSRQRIACLREYQTTIKDSSKRLIEDRITTHGLGPLFEVTETEIRGPHGSLFVFKGLTAGVSRGGTAESLKSLEGFTRAWVEEAQTISQRSIDLMTPTFRSGSEMWFTWNPKRSDGPVERLFSANLDDPDFVCVTVSYRDNPWFPEELRRDMERDRARDPDKYAHVWLGEFESHSEARVFKNWRVEAFDAPSDARFYFGADWGFANDPSVLVRCYRVGRTLFIDYEAWKVGCQIEFLPALFDTVPDARKWPIVADSARPETIDYMQRHGYPRIRGALKGVGSVEDGVEFMKSHDIVVHPRCVHVIDELATYSWKVDPQTEEVLPVLADKKNHTIDSVRYAVEATRRNEAFKIPASTLAALRARDDARRLSL